MAVKRVQILQALQTLLGFINGVGSFYNDLTDKVFIYRRTTLQDHELPAAIIRRTTNTFSEATLNSPQVHDQYLAVQIDLISRGGDIDACWREIEELIADVYAVIKTNENLGGLVMFILPLSDEVDVQEKSADDPTSELVGYGKINLSIFYRTTNWSES
jgi:hypothetical protein